MRGRPFVDPRREDRRPAEAPLVEELRRRVDDWRRSGYPGVTRTTAELIAYWRRDGRRHRLFFAQLEAVETVLFLVESRPDFRQGLVVPQEGFLRYACKMATGTGKTTVMALLAAWSIINRLHTRRDPRFSSVVLVVCPNLTVRDRLRELQPGAGSIYETRDLVPPALVSSLLRGRVVITHWHVLRPRTLRTAMGGAKVVRDIDEGDGTFASRLVGPTTNILVLNDEAHHAYRDGEDTAVWIEGLDRLHRARGINVAIDLSATPGDLPWVVSEFGLLEAIEAGLVKIPQRSGPADLWGERVSGARTAEAILDHVREPLGQFVKQWEGAFRSDGVSVLLLVCRDTRLARLVHEWLEGNSDVARGHSIRVDSQVSEESDEERWMRFTVDSVGRDEWTQEPPGFRELATKFGRPLSPPGANVRAVVCVGMLNEGWDCRTVTHIAGLRPFVSSLLCEQVVGRALRRTSYEPGTDGRFAEETAQVMGVPFDLAPFKISGVAAAAKARRRRIFEPAGREAFAIQVPRVERYAPGRRAELVVDAPPGPVPADAFALAAELTRRCTEVPAHVLFPQWLTLLRAGVGDDIERLHRSARLRWIGPPELAVFETRPRTPTDLWTDAAVLPVERSPLNAVIVGTDERKASMARTLDADPTIVAFADAAAIGLVIPGRSRPPDFLVKIGAGEFLLIDDNVDHALTVWLAAVTAAGIFGRWRSMTRPASKETGTRAVDFAEPRCHR